MTITGVETTTSDNPKVALCDLPKLVWAGAILLTVNLLIGAGMLITPDVEADIYGHEVQARYAADSKPSPFTEVVDSKKHKVRLAAKVRPVLVDMTPLTGYETYAMPVSTSLEIPRTSRAYQLDLPVRTQPALYEVPRRSERAIHQTTIEVTPRRVSEQDKRFVVIN